MQAEVYEAMDEKKYPIPEEEGNIGMASEPVAEYKATGNGYMNIMEEKSDRRRSPSHSTRLFVHHSLVHRWCKRHPW